MGTRPASTTSSRNSARPSGATRRAGGRATATPRGRPAAGSRRPGRSARIAGSPPARGSARAGRSRRTSMRRLPPLLSMTTAPSAWLKPASTAPSGSSISMGMSVWSMVWKCGRPGRPVQCGAVRGPAALDPHRAPEQPVADIRDPERLPDQAASGRRPDDQGLRMDVQLRRARPGGGQSRQPRVELLVGGSARPRAGGAGPCAGSASGARPGGRRSARREPGSTAGPPASGNHPRSGRSRLRRS